MKPNAKFCPGIDAIPRRAHRPWLLAPLALLMAACAANDAPRNLSPDYGAALKAGLASQVINPDAPDDASPAIDQPGDLAHQIYRQRYVPAMSEKKDEEDESVSSSLD